MTALAGYRPAVLREVLTAGDIALLTILSFIWFPGHTILQSDTQIYIPILEHIENPGVLTADPMAVRPHVAFTIYDEVTLGLRRLTGFGFESILQAQQLVFRGLGILGLFLLARAAGLNVLLSLTAAALVSLGATVNGPAVLTVEYEPVPRASRCLSRCLRSACLHPAVRFWRRLRRRLLLPSIRQPPCRSGSS